MRDMAGRQIDEKWRHVVEILNASRYDYSVCLDSLPVRGLEFEAFRSTADRSNIRLFQRWYQTLLKFKPVSREDFKGNWITDVSIRQIHLFAIMAQSERRVRIVEARRESF